MALTKKQKQAIIEDLKEKISQQKTIILVGISGLKVKEITELRNKLKGADANLKVIKKTLASLVFKQNKIDFSKDKFKEEIGFVFGFKDEVSPAKQVYQFAKSNKNVKILGGFIANEFKSKEEMISLAQLPTKGELVAQMFATIKFPISVLNNILQRNLSILKVKN